MVGSAPALGKGRIRPVAAAVEGSDAVEVRVHQRRLQPRPHRPRAQTPGKRRSARRVDQEPGLDQTVARPDPDRAGLRLIRNGQHLDRGLLAAVHALGPRPLEQEAVHVRAQPLVVGRLVVRRSGHDQAAAAGRVRHEGPARTVGVEAESPLQPTSDFGQPAPPAPVGGQRPQIVEAVAHRQPLQGQVGERRGGLAEREPGVAAALQQQHVAALRVKRPPQHRPRKPTTGNDYLPPLDGFPK